MTVYLNLFYRGKIGGSVSMAFGTEAEARQELRERAGGNEITGSYGGNIVYRDTVRASYSIETSASS